MNTPFKHLSALMLALGLAACGGDSQNESPAPVTNNAPAEASAPAASEAASNATSASAVSSAAVDANCTTVVEANDRMQFNTQEIDIPKSCANFTVTLKHTGSTAKMSMGHNIVISKASDMNGINSDGAGAGLDNGFLKTNDDRIIAHTDLIGGGEEASVTFPVSKLNADESYKFFCTFPGHAGAMNGVVKLVD